MSKSYEFAYQSPKQKAILLVTKIIILLLIVHSFYAIGWVDQDVDEKLRSIAGVCTGFWIYANLLSVKVEIQEIFVPPFKIFYAVEFMIAGLLLSLYGTFSTVANIVRLHMGF